MEKIMYVYIDLDEKPYFVGQIWSRLRKGRESASFEYSQEWLDRSNRFALEPGLVLMHGPQHTPSSKNIFGAFGDSAPDRWGRLLMRRAERRQAESEKRAPQTLMEIDFLLRVNDFTREGALRFSLEKNGPFLANNSPSIPPLLELPKLLSATERLANEKDTAEDLRLLLAPGSSLGGARPKASVLDKRDQLAIAKFPHQEDENNTVLWEALALTLAHQAKIPVPKWRIENVAGKSVLISHRFDRVGKKRIPFLSAMSLLSAHDNERRSYIEIVDAIRQYGSNVEANIHQLWRRMVFNILISNSDDHLRNHGFLYDGHSGWELSPAYDLNPIPVDIKARVLSTNISLDDGTASLELALSVADFFDLTPKQAHAIIAEVAKAVSKWPQEAKRLGLTKSEMNRMASAFTHDDLQQALSL
ncbi:type II toxin-antitoxin system HipA family toxin [Pelagibacteraceae bacterium]|nr:type II toxin-antitoxin system HipA family toxin [Pelagibacteraceae bacterium]